RTNVGWGIYLAFGEERFWERHNAKAIRFAFTSLPQRAIDERNILIKEWFGSIGDKIFIEPLFR
ncbi:MAG: hypothetical protein ACRCST_06090, partial [Turicibacter sp.]